MVKYFFPKTLAIWVIFKGILRAFIFKNLKITLFIAPFYTIDIIYSDSIFSLEKVQNKAIYIMSKA